MAEKNYISNRAELSKLQRTPTIAEIRKAIAADKTLMKLGVDALKTFRDEGYELEPYLLSLIEQYA